MSGKLLPCPFCGGEPYLHEEEGQRPDESSFSVHCDGCEATHKTSRGDDAVAAWNKRSITVELPEAQKTL